MTGLVRLPAMPAGHDLDCHEGDARGSLTLDWAAATMHSLLLGATREHRC